MSFRENCKLLVSNHINFRNLLKTSKTKNVLLPLPANLISTLTSKSWKIQIPRIQRESYIAQAIRLFLIPNVILITIITPYRDISIHKAHIFFLQLLNSLDGRTWCYSSWKIAPWNAENCKTTPTTKLLSLRHHFVK